VGKVLLKSDQCGIETIRQEEEDIVYVSRSNRTNVGLKPAHSSASGTRRRPLKSDQCGIETR